jgi:mannose-1-phosphate guanylyltransferase
MQHTNHNYVLIIAGGAGTRLWPVSRKDRPKQFQAFINEQTLLQNCVALTEQVVPLEQTFIMATEEFRSIILEQLPGLPEENILFEPARRDNGPATTLAMMQIHKRDPEAIVAILWSDHSILLPEVFAQVLATCFTAALAHPESLVSVAANPTKPDTGLGYIQIGKEVARYNEVPVFAVKRFVEKPDLETATKFVASWDYLWNVGYNVFSTKQFLLELNKAQPELRSVLADLQQAKSPTEIAKTYDQMPRLSIDILLIQKLSSQLVVPADFGWSDVGNWNTLHDVLKNRFNHNNAIRGQVLQHNTKNCLIFAKDRPIATVGLEDLIIVDDGDVILVMHKDHAQDIKQLTQRMEDDTPEYL